MGTLVSSEPVFQGPFGFAGAAILGLAIIAAWMILASSRFTQGGIVERPERVPQLYGYTVCLVTLFWAIASTVNIVESTLTLGAPEYRAGPDYGFEPSVSSFEAFRTTYDRSRRMMSMDASQAKLDSVPEPELHRRYEALRADRIQRNTVEARRSLITSVFSLIVAAVLFIWHWRWLKRVGGAATPGVYTRSDI